MMLSEARARGLSKFLSSSTVFSFPSPKNLCQKLVACFVVLACSDDYESDSAGTMPKAEEIYATYMLSD
jgi:hypothetical protein